MRVFKPLLTIVLLAGLLGVVGLSFAPGQDKKDKDKDKAGAVFEVYKDKSGEFRFRLKDDDTILAISGKGYKTKAELEKVIDAVKKEAAKAKVVEETKK